ncbi:hypothetical protein CEE45_08410 [Candidatus Heimdallarchaeota archaeon B3_Heim]|nr:MAG: hypothetical protein CEE45_08410 [Candidatus Heimdallarchaeota archaeon B3_Heim]
MDPLTKFIGICWKDSWWSCFKKFPFYEISRELNLKNHARFYYQAAGSHLPSLPLHNFYTHYYSDVNLFVLNRVKEKLDNLEEENLIQDLVINLEDTTLKANYVYKNTERKLLYFILDNKMKIQFPPAIKNVDLIYEQRSAGIVHKLDFWRELDRVLVKGGYFIGMGERRRNPFPTGHSLFYSPCKNSEIEIFLLLPSKYPYLDYSDDLAYRYLLYRINEYNWHENSNSYSWVKVPLNILGFQLIEQVNLNKETECLFVFQKVGSSMLDQLFYDLEKYEVEKQNQHKDALRPTGESTIKARTRMVQLHKSKPTVLPEDFLVVLPPNTKSVLVLFNRVGKDFRLVPTESPSVVKVAIETELTLDSETKSYRWFPPDFLQELGLVFMRNKIKMLYSKGTPWFFNPYQETWIFEGYIDSCNLKISDDQLKQELLKIKVVRNVEITKLTI